MRCDLLLAGPPRLLARVARSLERAPAPSTMLVNNIRPGRSPPVEGREVHDGEKRMSCHCFLTNCLLFLVFSWGFHQKQNKCNTPLLFFCFFCFGAPARRLPCTPAPRRPLNCVTMGVGKDHITSKKCPRNIPILASTL